MNELSRTMEVLGGLRAAQKQSTDPSGQPEPTEARVIAEPTGQIRTTTSRLRVGADGIEHVPAGVKGFGDALVGGAVQVEDRQPHGASHSAAD